METRTDRNPVAVPGFLLPWGLGLTLALAPLPFGAVHEGGRLAFELAALALGAVWLALALRGRARLPGPLVTAGLVGLLAWTAIQALPLGSTAVGILSPAAARRAASFEPPPPARAAEAELLGDDPARYDRPAALSADPPATASALRTGAALAFVFLAAAAVAREAGARALAWPLLAGAVFQALYGLAVLTTGDRSIWGVPKTAYLDAATGTFVNKNHFASYVAAGCACGFGLALSALGRALEARGRRRAAALFERDGAAAILAGFATLVALSGLLLSLSRAGIAVGAAASGAVLLAGARGTLPRRARLAAWAALLLVAAVPLFQLGAGRLAERYAQSVDDIQSPGARPAVWADALRIAAAHPLAGSGFGTFAAVHPGYRSPEIRQRYSHAHDDLVQLAAEGGAVGLALFTLLCVPVARAAVPALAGRHGPLWAGLAAALGAIAAHALVDFPFHIPAVAAVAAALAGALTEAPWTGRG